MSQIGLVVAAHGDLSESLIKTAELIVGEVASIETVNLDPTMNLEAMVDALRSAVEATAAPDGTLILLDLFGGTPCNAAAMVMHDLPCLAITGANLPMLLEVVMRRDSTDSLEELALIAQEAGSSGVVDVKARFDALSA